MSKSVKPYLKKKPVKAKPDDIEAALNRIVAAWEAVAGGRNYSPHDIERWLSDHMSPAINNARRVLGRY